MLEEKPIVDHEKQVSGFPMLENIFGQPASHQALLEFHAGTGQSVLQSCAARIRHARGRVIFSGMGASFFAAMPAVSRMEQQGCAVQALESAELLHYGTPALRREDIGVLISRSGGSIEVVRLAEKMRAAGMTILGVTNVAQSPLQKLADETLVIGALADQLIAVQTYTGTVLALLLLAEQVTAGRSERLIDLSLAALPLLSEFIATAERASDDGHEWLDGRSPLYLLARGPALASACEGALLLHETAKSAAVAMSSGQFRHGPVEVVSEEFCAVVFGSPEATRKTDRLLAADLARMGARVRWIGPGSSDPSDQPVSELLPWPEIPAELAQLFEIVPLQFAAYQLALRRGINPGDFRFASEITNTESGFPLLERRLAHR